MHSYNGIDKTEHRIIRFAINMMSINITIPIIDESGGEKPNALVCKIKSQVSNIGCIT